MRPSPGGEARLEALFWQVADPGHAEYLQHRTVAQLVRAPACAPRAPRMPPQVPPRFPPFLFPADGALPFFFALFAVAHIFVAAERRSPSRCRQPGAVF